MNTPYFILFFELSSIFYYNRCEAKNNVCKTFGDYLTIEQNPNCWHNPDVGASPPQIARNHGFLFERYFIEADDGFILQIFRIPKNCNCTNKRSPILLSHGLGGDGLTWLAFGSQSLAFVLANYGYDVWINNARGSRFSINHRYYTKYDKQFWNFSFHEMATYDIPRILEFIVQKTRQKEGITYIGHSMGNTVSYIYASLRPRHAKKYVKRFISLAPSAYLHHVKANIASIVPFLPKLKEYLSFFGIHGITANDGIFESLLHKVCQSRFLQICSILFQINTGLTSDASNPALETVLLSGFLTGSLKSFYHYAQIISTKGGFKFYDYGVINNRKLYNLSSPPEYPVEKIDVPVHLFYGTNDYFCVQEDVIYLYHKLTTRNKTIQKLVNFTHNDFLYGVHTEELYNLVVKFIN